MANQLQITCAACGNFPVPRPGDICRRCGLGMQAAQAATSIEQVLDAGGGQELKRAMSAAGYRRMLQEVFAE